MTLNCLQWACMNVYFTRGDLQDRKGLPHRIYALKRIILSESTARPFLRFLALQSLVLRLFEAWLPQALSWQRLGCQAVLIAAPPQISTDIDFYP